MPPRQAVPLNHKTTLVCGVLCLLGLAWSLAAFYPGVLTNDSVNQWKMASGQLSVGDWHPPMMSALWRLLLKLTPGPAGMLIFQTVLFWGGLYLASLASRPSVRGYWPALILLVGFLPSSIGLLGVIWKDISMGTALVMGSGLIFFGRSYSRNSAIYLSLPFFAYASTVRHNGMLAVFPLLVWAAHGVLSPRLAQRRRLHVGASIAAASVLIGLFNLGGRAVASSMKARREYVYQYQMLLDLSYLSIAVNHPYFPDYVANSPRFRFEELKQRFGREAFDSLFWGERAIFETMFDVTQVAKLEAVWGKAVVQHFSDYLAFKSRDFVSFMALDFRQPLYPLPHGNGDGEAGPAFPRTKLSLPSRLFFWSARDSILFRAGYWMALSLIFLAVGILRPPAQINRQFALALHASAVLYCATYFIFSPFGNFRYVWWCVIASMVGALLWLLPRSAAQAADIRR